MTQVKNIGSRVVKFLLRIWHSIIDGFKHLPYAFYIQVHPFDGFYRLKNDPRRRSISCAVILFIMLVISSLIKRQLTGYMFTEADAQTNIDVLYEISVVLAPYFLWVVANWCFTSLMDGDGKLSDIFCATAVATIPLMVSNLITTPLSHVLTTQEENLYIFIGGAGMLLTMLMIFFGMMITHQYTVKKSIATTILTLLGMCILTFIIILILYLLLQVLGFCNSLISEINFRMNE